MANHLDPFSSLYLKSSYFTDIQVLFIASTKRPNHFQCLLIRYSGEFEDWTPFCLFRPEPSEIIALHCQCIGNGEPMVDWKEGPTLDARLVVAFDLTAVRVIFGLTRMLHKLRSKLRILKSKTAILCTSSLSNILCEKFSIGPLLWMNSCSEPIFRFMNSD
jgi:hypothetical protein